MPSSSSCISSRVWWSSAPKALVHQQHARPVGQRARDRGALLHAARQLLRVVLLEARQPDLGDEAVGHLELMRARQAALAQPEADVVEHGQPGEERVALEHHAAVGPGAVDAPAVEQHLARGGHIQPGDDAQQRALAATVRSRGTSDSIWTTIRYRIEAKVGHGLCDSQGTA
jgi:hypothetical protein